MIRVLSSYISEEIEKRRLPEIIGKLDNNTLWIEWDTYVQQKFPKQLMERGADRTTVLLALLWINLCITFYFNSAILSQGFLLLKLDAPHLLIACYLIIGIYILYLSGKRYGEDLIRKT